jgi:thiol-disulfide isomerase/thioredoxin
VNLIKLLIFTLLSLTVAFAAGCKKDDRAANSAKESVARAIEGAAAPDFTVKDLAGQEVKLSALKGKVVFVNFWATWCPPCREEMPSMVKLNQAMAGKQFQMMAISIDEGGKEAVASYFKKSGITLPAFLDSDGAVSSSYGTTGVPETFIVDKTGIIRKKVVGGMDWSSPDVSAYLDELLKK